MFPAFVVLVWIAVLMGFVPELVDQILASPAHVTACNKFAHDLKTGKHAKAHSLSGLLLTILGLKKASTGPLSDKPAKTR